MELPNTDSPQPPIEGRSGSSLRSKLAIVGVSGMLFSGAVFGLTGLASAQSADENPAAETSESNRDADSTAESGQIENGVDVEVYGDDDGFSIDIELSPEDEALLESFEQCLADNGVVEEDIDAQLEADDDADIDWDAIDAAFETCEPILDDLSDDADALFTEMEEMEFGDFAEFGDFEFSPEDEALFEKFDQCLVDGGLDEEAIEDGEEADTLTEEDWESIDSIFEGCESILEDLSDDADFFFGDWEDCEDSDYDEGDHDETEDSDTANTVDAGEVPKTTAGNKPLAPQASRPGPDRGRADSV